MKINDILNENTAPNATFGFSPMTDNLETAKQVVRKLNGNMLVNSATPMAFDNEDTEKWKINIQYNKADAGAISRLISNLIKVEQDKVREAMVKQFRSMG